MNTRSLRGFLQEKSASRSAPAAPRVFLAAFGKHPGWNDHIDDLGFETHTLVAAKRYVYLEGIATQIDTGAWDRLDAANRFPAFDHWMLWQRGDETLCGVLVDSRDGKGRTRYPMVLCLHAIGVPLDQVVGEFAARLDQAMRDCMAVTTAEQVEAILDQTRRELRAKLETPPPPSAPREPLVGQAALGPENEGLWRILYQLRSQFASWAPGRSNLDDDENLPRPAALRAPQTLGSFTIGAPVWMDFFRSQLGKDAPVLFLWPRAAQWFDVVVGPPDAASFFVLKANALAVPLATEVPYQIDDAFRAEAAALAPEFGRGAAAQKTIFGEAPAPGKKLNLPGIQLGRAKRAVTESGRSMSGWWRSWSPTVVRALIAVFVVLALGVGALIYWGTRPAEARKTDSEASAGTAKDVDAATLQQWRALCTAQFDWFGPMLSELKKDPARRARWRQDTELRVKVLEKLDAADGPLMGFSPQRLANTSGSADALIATPPPSLAKPAVSAKVKQAAELVAEVGRAIQEWELRKRFEILETRVTKREWPGTVSELNALRQPIPLDTNLAKSIDTRLERLGDARAVEESLERVAEWSQLLAAGDPFLTTWVEQAELEAKHASTLTELREVLARRTQGVKDVVALLGDVSIDHKRLAAESPLPFKADADQAPQVAKWLEHARGFAVLSDAERPLADSAWTPRLARLRQQVKTLQALVHDATASEFARDVEALGTRREALRRVPALRRDLARLRETAAKLEADAGVLSAKLDGELARRTDPAGWIAALREIRIEGSPAIAAEWTKRRDQLLADASGSLSPEAFIALQDTATRTEEFLRALGAAAELPTQLAPTDLAPTLKQEFAPVIARRREALIVEMLRAVTWDAGKPAKAWPDFIASGEPAKTAAEYRKELAQLGQFAEWMQRVTRLLGDGVDVTRLTEKNLGPPDADADVLGLASVGALRDRLERVQAAASGTERARLLSDATALDFAVAVNAWRALGRLPDWPVGSDEIQDEARVRGQLLLRVKRLDAEAGAKAALERELQSEARRRWEGAVSRARSAADWQAIFASREASGGDISGLSARAKYNEWIWRAKQIPWRDLSNDDFTKRRAALVAEWQKLPEAGAKESWLGSLESISTQEEKIDLTQVGPGVLGWKLSEGKESGVLSYSCGPAGKAALRLDFRLIEPVVDRPVYLCTTELPVGLLLQWAEEKKLWPDLLVRMKDLVDENGKRDSRRGPRVYGFAPGKLVQLSSWLTRPNADYYPDGVAPAAPSAESPLNYVPPAAAEFVASSLNCRLPTTAEWQAALAMAKAQVLSPIGAVPANRRDLAWQRQNDFVARWPAGKDRQFPDSEAFVPVNVLLPPMARPAVDYDDQTLWFRKVGDGGAEPFLNLVGNVAEFVKDGTTFAAIGASALSVAEIEPEKPYRTEAIGYSDVGVRLAFTIDRLTPGQRAARIVESAAYR